MDAAQSSSVRAMARRQSRRAAAADLAGLVDQQRELLAADGRLGVAGDLLEHLVQAQVGHQVAQRALEALSAVGVVRGLLLEQPVAALPEPPLAHAEQAEQGAAAPPASGARAGAKAIAPPTAADAATSAPIALRRRVEPSSQRMSYTQVSPPSRRTPDG